MKAYEKAEVLLPSALQESGQLHAPASSPQARIPGTKWVGVSESGWNPEEKNSQPYWKYNLDFWILACNRCYTQSAIRLRSINKNPQNKCLHKTKKYAFQRIDKSMKVTRRNDKSAMTRIFVCECTMEVYFLMLTNTNQAEYLQM
jgi:hypothetical protein